MKKLKEMSKSLSELNVEKLLGNQMENLKGGTKSAPCFSCATGCKLNCVSGQVSKLT